MIAKPYGLKTNPPRPTLEESLWRVRANETPLGPSWSDWWIDVVKSMSPTIFTDTDLNARVVPGAGWVRVGRHDYDHRLGIRIDARAYDFPWQKAPYIRWTEVPRENGLFVGAGTPEPDKECECCDEHPATWAIGIGGGWLVVCDACRQFGIDDPEQDITADDYVRIPASPQVSR